MSGLTSATTTVLLATLALAGGSGLGRWWGARHLVRPAPGVAGWPLIAAGVVLRLLVEAVPLPAAAGLVVVSHALVLAACLRNLRHPGVPVMAVGVALMLAPTVVDGGMPVSRAALATMGAPAPAADLPGGRHLGVERDRLTILGDLLPLPVGGRPVSFGELILLAGLASAAFHAAGGVAGRHLGRLGVLRSVPVSPAASQRRAWSELDLAELDDEAPTVVVLGPAASRPARPPRPRPLRRPARPPGPPRAESEVALLERRTRPATPSHPHDVPATARPAVWPSASEGNEPA